MGRTRGVFSSPKSEGARGFKSSSLRQAGSDLWHSLENPARFALYAVVRAPESDRMGLFWAHSADFSPRRGDPGPFADATPISPLNRRPPEHEALASGLKHQLLVLPIRR
jgi:hypothetical protein